MVSEAGVTVPIGIWCEGQLAGVGQGDGRACEHGNTIEVQGAVQWQGINHKAGYRAVAIGAREGWDNNAGCIFITAGGEAIGLRRIIDWDNFNR